jgi:hypothetical protein
MVAEPGRRETAADTRSKGLRARTSPPLIILL